MHEYTFPVLRVEQPLGEFLVAVIPANILLELTYSDVFRYTSADENGMPIPEGHQRKLNPERLKAIGRYIDTVESAFPNSIILAANYKATGEFEEDELNRWSVEFRDNEPVGVLHIPSNERLAAVVDGQHRLNGFREASLERQQMPLLCAIYLDLPNPYQAYLFATINHNQKPVDKSLSYELYGYDLDEEKSQAWSPEKLAVFFSRRLNADSESTFFGHVAVVAQTDKSLEMHSRFRSSRWLVSTATIVEGCLSLFSSNPKRDRDRLYQESIRDERKREDLVTVIDHSPMRQLYLSGNDLLLYTVIKNFFLAVELGFWKNGEDPGFIRKTVGVQALFLILKMICRDALDKKNVSVDYFRTQLSPAFKINFHDNFFHASGAGKARIKNVIALCLGLIDAEDCPERDRADYIRVLEG
jgi:DNA phosphorothioation-associated DGQHR protein 1